MISPLTLIQLLEKEDFPIHEIPHSYNWLAQDAVSKKIFAYRSKPIRNGDFEYTAIDGGCVYYVTLKEIAHDWENPVHLVSYREKPKEVKPMTEATKEQPMPKGKGTPIVSLVVKDLMDRAFEGTEKYGEPLKKFNSRNAAVDAYQEVCDLAMYLRQDLEERAELAEELIDMSKVLSSINPYIASRLIEISNILNPKG